MQFFESVLTLSKLLVPRSLSLHRRYLGNRSYARKPIENLKQKKYRVVVVGGGTGGCSSAARLCRAFPGGGNVAVIEPAENHAYQPLWTLVGGGVSKLQDTMMPTAEVLPSDCDWIKQKAKQFDPENNTVITENGDQVSYEYLVVAMGIQLNYHLVKGLQEALVHDPKVCSNYSHSYVTKTYPAMQNFTEGNAIFTFPNTPIKCAGAPQKIMYLTEEYFRKSGKREKAKVIFNTSLGAIFAVKKYADALSKIVKDRDITVNHRTNLVEVRHEKQEAVFINLDTGKDQVFNYAMLHAVPPMSAPDILKSCPLSDSTGYLDVDKDTLQHKKYANIYGIGDCTNLPTSKTAAAIASQNKIMFDNLMMTMKGKDGKKKYDGYTSCPLVTGRGKCIMAEFDYNLQPLETFPINQGKERQSMYLLKKDFLPQIYWRLLLKGRWSGPTIVRKLTHMGAGK